METPPVTTPAKRDMPRWIAPILIVLIAVALQYTIKPLFKDYVESVAIDTAIAIIMAVSLNIVNGYTGQFSIGHAAFFAIGGYTAAAISFYGSLAIYNSTTVRSPWTPQIGLIEAAFASVTGSGLSATTGLFIIGTIIGGIVAAIAGWIVGLPSLRLKGDYLAIVTLGFGEIVRILLQQTNAQLFSREEIHAATASQLLPPPLGGALGFINTPKVTTLFWAVLFVGITLLVAWRLKKSTFGRSMIAIRENEIAAESMGVNVTRLKVWAFVIGAFFAGLAGSLYSHKLGTSIGPKDAGFVESFNIVIMVVLGGLGSISGAALAAVLYVVAQQWLLDPTHIWHVALIVLILRLMLWPAERTKAAIWGVALIAVVEGLRLLADSFDVKLGDYRIILFALILIVVMIQRPGGLFGTHEISDLLRMRRKLATGQEVPT